MKKNVKLFVFISAICLVIISGLSSCYYDNEDYLYSTGGACTDTVYTYNGRIKAIMDQNCSSIGRVVAVRCRRTRVNWIIAAYKPLKNGKTMAFLKTKI
jgi:hypothetical protein